MTDILIESLRNLAERDDAVQDKMIDVLMEAFPGPDGFETVVQQLPHLYIAMAAYLIEGEHYEC